MAARGHGGSLRHGEGGRGATAEPRVPVGVPFVLPLQSWNSGVGPRAHGTSSREGGV